MTSEFLLRSNLFFLRKMHLIARKRQGVPTDPGCVGRERESGSAGGGGGGGREQKRRWNLQDQRGRAFVVKRWLALG